MSKRITLALSLAAVGLAAVGCGSTVAGQPAPTAEAGSAQATSSASPTTSAGRTTPTTSRATEGSGSPLKGLDPCGLLNGQQPLSYPLQNGERTKIIEGCRYQSSRNPQVTISLLHDSSLDHER